MGTLINLICFQQLKIHAQNLHQLQYINLGFLSFILDVLLSAVYFLGWGHADIYRIVLALVIGLYTIGSLLQIFNSLPFSNHWVLEAKFIGFSYCLSVIFVKLFIRSRTEISHQFELNLILVLLPLTWRVIRSLWNQKLLLLLARINGASLSLPETKFVLSVIYQIIYGSGGHINRSSLFTYLYCVLQNHLSACSNANCFCWKYLGRGKNKLAKYKKQQCLKYIQLKLDFVLFQEYMVHLSSSYQQKIAKALKEELDPASAIFYIQLLLKFNQEFKALNLSYDLLLQRREGDTNFTAHMFSLYNFKQVQRQFLQRNQILRSQQNQYQKNIKRFFDFQKSIQQDLDSLSLLLK